MNIPSLVAASRLVAQERAIEVTAGNLANMNTPGYQASRVKFADWLSAQHSAALPGERQIAYTQDRATWRDTTPGTVTQTGNTFDLAVRNGGYFTVNTPNGPRLTRDGRFGPLPDGRIGDAAGNPLLDTTGKPIQIGPADTRIVVVSDGSVSSENGLLGQIGVVTPADPMKLQAEGGTLFRAETPTAAVAQPGMVQGAVESSNVSAVSEMTQMMQDERDFQFATQFIQSEDDRIQSTIEKTLGTST